MKKVLCIVAITLISCNNSSDGAVSGTDSNVTNATTTTTGAGSDSANIPGSSTTTGAGIGAGTDSNLNKTPDTIDRH